MDIISFVFGTLFGMVIVIGCAVASVLLERLQENMLEDIKGGKEEILEEKPAIILKKEPLNLEELLDDK